MKDDALEISDTDVAVIGMAGHFPGASNVDEFWSNLRNGVESIRPLSDAELLACGQDPASLRDPRYVKRAAILDGYDLFDASFFGVSPKDAAIMDPQHRHLLECAWEALEHAGHVPSRFRGSIGVFAGCGANAYFMHNILANPDLVRTVGLFLLRHTGNDKDFLATLVSYKLNLTGPSFSVQTACSTSLVAIHLACQHLLTGQCDLALAGGATIDVPQVKGYLYERGEILSPDGHCRAFDADAQGTVFGSGAGIVVLRRLRDAVDDGDYIHAVVKASAINNDGAMKAGYLAPSIDGQAQAIAEAIALSGIDPDTISYVETHGTGTAVGDPIEIAALTQAFRHSTVAQRFCAIGSTKPNIGHLDTAAGVASFIKVVQALAHGELPPSLHFRRANPAIEFESSPFFVNTALSAWHTNGHPRRAGVSSLGVGGTNAHVVLEEHPPVHSDSPSRPHQLLLLASKTAGALDRATQNLADALEKHPELALADIAYTLQVGRQHFEHRRAVVASSHEQAVGSLRRAHAGVMISTDERTSLVFMYPGGGAQYLGMAVGLYRIEPVFREQVELGLALLEQQVDADVRSVMLADPNDARAAAVLERPSVQLPMIFVIEYALTRLWISWGVRPQALIGHSLGENTAGCVAGVFSYEDALHLVSLRGRLFERVRGGGMLSVQLPAEQIERMLQGGLSLAAINAPSLSVVSGPADALDELQRELTARTVEHQRVKIAVPAHGAMLEPILPEFRAYLRSITLHQPRIPFVSNVTGTWIEATQAMDPEYWVTHLRSTVRFADGVVSLLHPTQQGDGARRLLLEIGPGKTLTSLARQSVAAKHGHAILSSLRHSEEQVDDSEFMLGVLGGLWTRGVEIDWQAFHRNERRRRVPLPSYPFQRQRYWIEPGKREVQPNSRPSLEQRDFEQWFYRPFWSSADKLDSDSTMETNMRWLLFVDAEGIGTELAKRLMACGHEVVTVREGDVYCKLSERSYALAPEFGKAGYEQLLVDLSGQQWVPHRIVHLWTLAASARPRRGSSRFHHHLERGFYSLFHLAQVLSERSGRESLHLVAVSNGMRRVHDEPVPYPEKATILGPVLVLPRELPNVTCSSIDVTLGESSGRPSLLARLGRDEHVERVVDELMRELSQPPANVQVAWRRHERFTLAYEPTRLEDANARACLREHGTYVITGGLGAIGLSVAERLSESVHANVVLLARSEFPAREQWDHWLTTHGQSDSVAGKIRRILAIERQGSRVLVVSADVANVDQMRIAMATVARQFGTVHGVFHAAGTTDDQLIQMKTESSIESVLAAKVMGTLVLTEVLRETKLELLVLFSSTSSILAPAGQVDYVAANCFLNAFADSRASGSCRTVAINWGVWKLGLADRIVRNLLGEGNIDTEHELANHPLLDEFALVAPGVYEFTSEYRVGECWLLDEHRMADGRAIVPGTGYLEIVRAAYAQVTESSSLEIADCAFIEPLEVSDQEVRKLRVVLTQHGEGYSFEISSRSADGSERWRLHAQGEVRPLEYSYQVHLPLEEIKARCRCDAPELAIRTKQEDHLKFGARWKNLRVQWLGDGESLALIRMDDAFHADLDSYRLHPAMLDLATGHGLVVLPGYQDCTDFYVPLSYASVHIHGPLTNSIHAWARLHGSTDARETATFDVVITDDVGKVLVEVSGFTMRRLSGSSSLGVSVSPRERDKNDGSLSPAELRFVSTFEHGITAREGTRALERVLASGCAPQVVVSSLDLDQLIENANKMAIDTRAGKVEFARPELDNAYVPPTDELERTLVGYWQEFLGVERVGIEDDFFHLGGHSLIAVRMFAKIKRTFDVEYPLSVLFEAPTIAKCAAMLRQTLGNVASQSSSDVRRVSSALHYVVAMNRHDRAVRPPLFIVSGMFGNVLNLRHLATHLESSRKVYAIQARGLFGDDEPHVTFEDMAAAYIEELRAVQPNGPYYLGGFSGGGITALEMSHQLLQNKQDVALVALIDTPAPWTPDIDVLDKLKIHLLRLRQHGPAYVTAWAGARLAWETAALQKRLGLLSTRELTPAEFRSEQIEAAFRHALARYRPKTFDARVVLFRPPLDQSYALDAARVANARRELVDPYNHWKPYIKGDIEVFEVSGDHDSMVLEPHVRSLVTQLERCLEQTQSAIVCAAGQR